MPPVRQTVFVSYSHKNKRWLKRLQVHLTPYERSGVLQLWDDSRIAPGDLWHAEIQRAIDVAAVSVVLISADFLASDFVVTHELPKLLGKADRAGAKVLPIFLEPCDLTMHPELACLQALNSPAVPLSAMSKSDAESIFVRAATTIGKLFPSRSQVQQPPERTRQAVPSGLLFEQLNAASIALSVLWVLRKNATSFTLTEIEKAIQTRSRKRAFEALDDLATEGWIEKTRTAGLTKYQLTTEGARQIQRLVAASDGPLRRATEPPT